MADSLRYDGAALERRHRLLLFGAGGLLVSVDDVNGNNVPADEAPVGPAALPSSSREPAGHEPAEHPSEGERPMGSRARILAGASIAAIIIGIISGAITIRDSLTGPLPVSYTDVQEPALDNCGEDIPFVDGSGWGPAREMFTVQAPAGFPTLNSIQDNPNYGNEGPFFDVKNVTHTDLGGFCGRQRVADDQQLLLRVYVENSAADNLAWIDADGAWLEDPQHPGIARDVRLRMYMDEQAATLRLVTAELTSSTTTPETIYDRIILQANEPFRLDFIRGSAVLYSNHHPKGLRLKDAVWGEGVLIGSSGLDGMVPPGYYNDFIITAQVRVTAVR